MVVHLTVPVLAAVPSLRTAAFGMHVVSTNCVPVAAERAMWWPRDGGTRWTEGQVGAGAPATGVEWATAEGVLGGSMAADTSLMVVNPSTTAGEVQMTLHLEDGRTPATVTLPIGAQRRLTLQLLALLPDAAGAAFSVHVASVGAAPVPLVVEQSVYWADARGAGLVPPSLLTATRCSGVIYGRSKVESGRRAAQLPIAHRRVFS